ncbi:MAG: hypothetical protein ACKO0W_01615 [Planctomycetota bacterium]
MHESLGAFRADCDAAIGILRQAIRDLASAAACDPLRPQEVARRFAINKNLTWKIARVLVAEDAFEAIPMIPGPEGVEIYLRAFESAGISTSRTDSVRRALQGFESVVERHFGGRSQLEVVLDGIRSDGNLESSRRMAFKGMAGVFGLQTRVRLTTQILSPSVERPGFGDYSLIVGLAGLQRLRPIGALPVFRAGGAASQGNPPPAPFMTSSGGEAPDYFLRDFSTFPNATVGVKPGVEGRFAIELSEGPVGRIGESDLFFATTTKGAITLRRRHDDESCSLVTAVSIPSEALASDLFVHRSIDGLDSLRASMHATLSQPLTEDPEQRRVSMLPIQIAPLVIEDLSIGFALTGAPRYEEMVRRAFHCLKLDPAEFRLIRVAMDFPPAPSSLLVQWDLPA